MPQREPLDGWAWFDTPGAAPLLPDAACHSAAAWFATEQGQVLLGHLRRVFLDRRVPPTASDAELRYVEGQRSVVSYLLLLLDRGRGAAGRPTPPSPS
jgi:hypothetical protein